MARRRTPERPPLETRELTPAEIEQGIARFRRRIEDVRALDPHRIRYNDQQISNVEQAIRTAILEIFGENSPQFRANGYHQIWSGGHNYLDEELTLQSKFASGIPQTITMLEGLIAQLEERRAEQGQDASARARNTFQGLDLNPRIADACVDLYQDGHYSQAVLRASIALVNYVKERSRRDDLDGTALMRTVFSANNPILVFNDLADQTQRDEQEGMMHLFEGAVLALRNPRAHALLDDSPEDALEYIAFLNFLARQVERARRR